MVTNCGVLLTSWCWQSTSNRLLRYQDAPRCVGAFSSTKYKGYWASDCQVARTSKWRMSRNKVCTCAADRKTFSESSFLRLEQEKSLLVHIAHKLTCGCFTMSVKMLQGWKKRCTDFLPPEHFLLDVTVDCLDLRRCRFSGSASVRCFRLSIISHSERESGSHKQMNQTCKKIFLGCSLILNSRCLCPTLSAVTKVPPAVLFKKEDVLPWWWSVKWWKIVLRNLRFGPG